jgi:hypothetical protein
MNIRRILAATDFSEGARAAVERAARREPGQGCAVRRHGRTDHRQDYAAGPGREALARGRLPARAGARRLCDVLVTSHERSTGLKIGISGSYGGFNLGDEAILHVILSELRRSVATEITVFSRAAEDTRRRPISISSTTIAFWPMPRTS